MNRSGKFSGWAIFFSGVALVVFAGCLTGRMSDPGAGSSSTNALGTNKWDGQQAELLRVGDLVKIDFSGPSTAIPFHEENIKQDGTISLNLVGSVKAAGKSTGELQRELNEKYTNFFRNLTVTVRAQERFYSVGGEVKKENRQVYVGPTTLTRAIQSAEGFTDFANRRKIQITRESGKIEFVDWKKAIKNPRLDVPIYPGDSIIVTRTLWR